MGIARLNLLVAALLFLSGFGRAQAIRSVDFRNQLYSVTRAERVENVALTDGHFRFPNDPAVAPGVSLLSVAYGDLDHDGVEEAVVVLRYDNAGSALHHDYLFVFKTAPASPVVWYSNHYEAATSIVLRGKTIVVKAPSWLPNDPHCCPTYDARYTIGLSEGTLRVVATSLHRRVTAKVGA